MTLSDVQVGLAIAGGAITIAVALFGAPSLLRVGKWMSSTWGKTIMFFNAGAQLARLQATQDAILSELRPNGGSSLRDAIDRTQADVARAIRIAQGVDARTQFMLDNEQTPAFENDGAGHAIWMNRSMLSMVDRPIEEMIGSGWFNAVYAPDRKRVREAWEAAVSEARIFEDTYRFVTRKGRITECNVIAKPVIREGHVVGWVGRAVPKNA